VSLDIAYAVGAGICAVTAMVAGFLKDLSEVPSFERGWAIGTEKGAVVGMCVFALLALGTKP